MVAGASGRAFIRGDQVESGSKCSAAVAMPYKRAPSLEPHRLHTTGSLAQTHHTHTERNPRASHREGTSRSQARTMRSTTRLQLLASRVAAAVAREARGGGGSSNITRAASTTPAAAASAASSAAAAAATAPPPPPIVTVRGLDADGTASTTARRAESIALLRRLNVAALPELRGQTVLARVVRASRHELLLDPGYYGLCSVPREGVMPAAAPGGGGGGASAADEAGGGGAPGDAPSSPHQSSNANPSQVRVGDYVRVRLSELHTPYGDPQLDPVRTPRAARDKLVLRELARRMRQGAPVAGRVLNACPGGYAVGVGGYVALLRTEQAPAEVVRAVGVLQPFYVHKMSRGSASGGKPGSADADAGGGRRRGRRGSSAADAQRPLIELTCTIQRAGGGGGGGGDADGPGGGGGLYSNV